MSNVVVLKTNAQRRAEEEKERDERARESAVRLLEEALAVARSTEGERVVGVAIAMAYSDRAYGHYLQLDSSNTGCLIAALRDCEYRLLKRTNAEEE